MGFAKRGRAEADGREQGRRCPGPAKRTKDGYGRRRCTETGRNGSMGAAKRTRGHWDGRRCSETGRNGSIGAAKRMRGAVVGFAA